MPSLHPPPLDARKNFLIDSTREYTVLVFSSRLFFPACLRQGRRGKWSCRAYRFPSIGSLSRQKRLSLSLFFSRILEKSVSERTSNSCYPSREVRFSAARGGGGSVVPTFPRSHPFSPSKRERGRGEKDEDTRYTSGARGALSAPTIARSECRVRARAAVAGRFPVVSYPRRGK